MGEYEMEGKNVKNRFKGTICLDKIDVGSFIRGVSKKFGEWYQKKQTKQNIQTTSIYWPSK
jgi:hypothetical protein